MPNLKKVGILAIAVLIAQLILTKGFYPIIGKETVIVGSIYDSLQPVSGIGGIQISNTIIGYLSGFIPFSLTDFGVLILMYLGTFLIVLSGFFLYEQKYINLWKGKNLTQRIFAILLYGHIVLFLFLWLLKRDVSGIGLNLLIGLAANLIFITVLITISVTKLKFPKI